MISQIKSLALLLNSTSMIEMNTMRVLITEVAYMQNNKRTIWNMSANPAFEFMVSDIYQLDQKIQQIYTFNACPTDSVCKSMSDLISGNLCNIYSSYIDPTQCSTIANQCALNVIVCLIVFVGTQLRAILLL